MTLTGEGIESIDLTKVRQDLAARLGDLSLYELAFVREYVLFCLDEVVEDTPDPENTVAMFSLRADAKYDTATSVESSQHSSLANGDLIEGVTFYFEKNGFNGDMANGFRSGLEAALGITAGVEIEDLSSEDIAEREALLQELRARVAGSIGSTFQGAES
jgi:hypothetical protein